MGLNSTPAYARVLSHPEIVLRNVQRGIFGSHSGAVRYGDFAMTPTATTRQFSVAAGRAYIHGRENASQGGYVAASDGPDLLTVPAPAASPRIDTVLLRIYDEQYGTLPSGTSRAQWDVVAGVAGGSPVARPDSDFLFGGSQYVPGAWWRVGDIRSNPGDTTIPTNQIYATMDHVRVPGAETLCLSKPNTAGFGGRPTDAVLNEAIREVDTGRRWTWSGTVWLPDPNTSSEIRRVASLVVATSASFVTVPFDDEGALGARDPLGVWASGSPTRLTIPAGMDGEWNFKVLNMQWGFNATGSRAACFGKNGTNINVSVGGGTRLGQVGGKASDSTETATHPEWTENAVAGDYYELWGNQNSGGNLEVVTPSGFPLNGIRVRARRLGPAL